MHMTTNNTDSTTRHITVTSSDLPVVHVKIVSSKPYDLVKQTLESRLGRLSDAIRELLRKNEIEAVREALKAAAGEDGLAIHYVGPHGDWLALQGARRKATSYLIGNVLYAVQMTSIDLAAGLYAPLRVVLYEDESGCSVFEYDRPSTQFGQFCQPGIDDVAAILDQRLHTLLIDVCAP
jgi:uncharacterized protein (DUF302 family)